MSSENACCYEGAGGIDNCETKDGKTGVQGCCKYTFIAGYTTSGMPIRQTSDATQICTVKSSVSIFMGDYINTNQLIFYNLDFSIYPLNIPITISKGILDETTVNGAIIKKTLDLPSLYSLIEGGMCYISGLQNTLILFRINSPCFKSNINLFTSLATSFNISTNYEEAKKTNQLLSIKIGVPIREYNFYNKNYYYGYNKNVENKYALQLIRVSALIRFIWNIVYLQAILKDINIDFPFTIDFYLAIFNNLKGTDPILTSQLNLYFEKYTQELIPKEYDAVLIKWLYFISIEKDIIKLYILKQSSFLLSYEELIKNEPTEDNLKLNRLNIYNRANECYAYYEQISQSIGNTNYSTY